MANTLTWLIFLLFVSLQIQASNPIDWIEEENAAIALNNLTLYSDSSFSGRTVAFYKEKSLFKVIRKTASFYEDDAQKQLFRWFQVETPDHRIGWIFGNDLAVMEQAYRVPKTLKGYYKREKYFPNHFGNAKIWVASMEGKDLLSDRKRLKPSYREEYLIFTNRDLISDFILITTYNLYGASSLKEIQLKDITGNGTRDLVVETEYFETGTTKANRDVEIYSFQQNQLEKIFEESISLEMQGRKRSPCGFKHVSIQPQTIRVEYIDFTDCNKGSETISWQISSTQEYCVDFVTYTYNWNQDNQKFDLLYAPTRSKVSGRLIFPDTWMRDQPGNYGRRKLTLQYAEVVNVKELVSNDDTAQNDWFLIEIDNGDTGYIPANALMLRQTVHAGIINAYYNGQTQTNRKFVELENF